MNYPNTLMFNLGLILTFVVFFTQALFIFVGIKSVINYVKQNKIKNNNEQSN